MSVVLNEAALRVFLESEEGPVGQFIERQAEQVVAQAQQNVRSYFGTSPSLLVDQDIGFDMEGSTATIGIKDVGNKSRRLARLEAEGKFPWLRSALRG